MIPRVLREADFELVRDYIEMLNEP